jgi:exonuclease SbcC
MIFKKLVLENIRSYENVEVEFPKGSLLLAGDIGSGKTSILLGLQFALFGLQPGQKGSSILRQGADNAYARLDIDVEGEIVTLERTIKKSSNGSITQDSNAITIGRTREELSTSEMKERVVRLLNYPREFIKKSNLLYKFTVYTPQEEMKEIIQERPEVRLDTLRHIFGIDRYKRIQENATIFLQRIKELIKLKEVLIGELNLLKEKHNEETESKIALAREINNLDVEHTLLTKERQNVQEKMNSLQRLIEDKRNIDSEISKSKIMLQAKRDLEERMKREMALMQRQIHEKVEFSEERLRSVIDLLEKHRRLLEEKTNSLLEVSARISALESRREIPQKLRDKIISLENCPTCQQKVEHEHKDKISKRTQEEIEAIGKELDKRFQEKQVLLRELENEKKLVRGYESDKNMIQQDKIKFEHQRIIDVKLKSDAFVLDRTTNEISAIQTKIDSLVAKAKSYEQTQQLFDKANLEFLEFNERIRSREIVLAAKNREMELLKKRIGELQDEIANKEKIREEVKYLRSLQDWLQEKFIAMITLTEKNVMAKLRSEFSQIFSEWFSMLVSDALTVRLDEDFTPLITNQDYEIDYEFLSGGERTAVALAYRLALNQVLNSLLSRIKTKGLVILDEPTDGFADTQIDKMRDIFEQLKAEQIILVSHEQKIEGFVDHIIRITKEGTSRAS